VAPISQIAVIDVLERIGSIRPDLLEEQGAYPNVPVEKVSPVPIAATVALAMIGPIPGTLISRSQPASWPAIASFRRH
jgi:hypothetical protein